MSRPNLDREFRLVALVTDLMDRSRIAAALPSTQFVSDAIAVTDADVVVVDLARFGGVIGALRTALPAATLLAFGSHVDREAAANAVADGADTVLTRSQFFADPAAAVRGTNDPRGQTMGQGNE